MKKLEGKDSMIFLRVKKIKNSNDYFLIFLLLFSNAIFSQEYMFSGVVLSEEGKVLSNANVLVETISDDIGAPLKFSISDDKGQFKVFLNSHIDYEIRISHLGYFTYTLNKKKSDDNNHVKIFLKSKNIELDEIVINYEYSPVKIAKDTITYNTNAFVNGNERKLREVLKKLPGIEVDREGNVTAQGRRVTKVLVEDKIFFTGNSKLAVNNIPADAVDKVQILDNYNEIGFLKGLQDSDDLALNIKLKEDKKKFAFGDVEVGAGVEGRYIVHPNLFYYSPKTTINFIGDANNTGVKSFTFNDYLEFNGGVGELLSDIGSYLNLSNDDFSQFLLNNDFKSNTNRFGAFNLRQAVSSKVNINNFIIASSSNTETETSAFNTFSNNGDPFNENRTTNNNLNNFFVLGKLTVDYEPNSNEDLAANTFFKISNNDNAGSILTQSSQQNNTFSTFSNLDAIDLKQNVEYSKRFSRAQTLSLEISLNYQKSTADNSYETNQAFLAGLIPLQEDASFNILQEKETHNTFFNFVAKDYWVLNNFNHLYTSAGVNLAFENYQTQEIQQLTDGGVNDFSENGFGNAIDYRFNDIFLGLEYKFLTGIFTVKSGVFYHNYNYDNEQFGVVLNNRTDALLPEFNAEAEFNNSEKLRFRFRQRLRFPESNRLVGNFLLSSFNSVLRGNPNLQNERFRTYSLSYSKFSLFRGLNLATRIFYNRKTQSIKNTTALDGIEQFVTYTIFNQPENSLSGNFNLSKKIHTIKLGLNTSGNYNEFFQLVNDNVSKNISRSFSLTGKVETYFEKLPNVEIGYTYEPSLFSTSTFDNTFINTEFFANLQYDFLKDFQLKADYKRVDFNNRSQNTENIFDLANASLYYQKEDSPWGFEISSTNLFNTQFKQQSSFSDFLVSDQSTFIIPRILLFKLSYKL